MNPLVMGLFNKFREEEELTELPENDAFELFAASLALGGDVLEQTATTDLLLDSSTVGIDVCVLEINGQVVWDAEDVKEICESTSKIDVAVTFIQAKRSEGITSAEILSFGDTVRKFLNNDKSLESYPRLAELAQAFRSIFDNHASILKTSPSVTLAFVTTASSKATKDTTVQARAATSAEHINDLGFLGRVTVNVWGSDDLHDAWRKRNQANEVEFRLERPVNLPQMQGVDQAILGVVSVAELLKLVRFEDGSLDERVFYDNVRGFKGSDNRVNKQIMETLGSDERSLLPVLNNGVTVVASSYSPKPGDNVAIAGFQIVNGCQTSHCLHLADLEHEIGDVYVPIRLVVTNDEDVATRIIRATNSQTAVGENELVALTKFQRKLEDFYRSDSDDVQLIYERRSGQFYNKDVTKSRIVTISDQMRAVSAVFLDNPHTAARAPGQLYGDVGESIFRDDHKLLPYVASAFAAYKLENAFRNGLNSSFKPVRYHILMVRKYIALQQKSSPLALNSAEAESRRLIEAFKAPDQVALFRQAAEKILEVAGGTMPSRDRLKGRPFTTDLISSLVTGTKAGE